MYTVHISSCRDPVTLRKEVNKVSCTHLLPQVVALLPYLRHFICHARQQQRDQLVVVGIPGEEIHTISVMTN